jgi:putative tryptophan/tyrosine transport system substrate-binding protein
MRRRAFIGVLGGAAAWPLAAPAQPNRSRRVGMLMGNAKTDPTALAFLAAFKQGLAALGWSEGKNIYIEVRRTAGDVSRAVSLAKELVALQLDAILANTTPVAVTLQRETKAIPIVFVAVADPVGSGLVESVARPGGNITGFLNMEGTLSEKWLELLKEIAPRSVRVALMFNPQTALYAEYYLRPLQAVAPKLGVATFATPVRSADDIEAVFARMSPDGVDGLILMNDSFIFIHRTLIIELAARYKIPAIYFVREMTAEGGLISYGVVTADSFERAAQSVDRILRGAKPAELPVQAPTKFELVINLKTAKALGLMVPDKLLSTADELIE